VLRVPLFEKPWSRGTTRTQNSSPEYPVSVTRFEIHHWHRLAGLWKVQSPFQTSFPDSAT
jgi:hypothetical protein